jgi:hypothetical protein
MRAQLRWATLLLLTIAASGCGPKVDLTKGLQAVDVSTGWWDAGLVNGQNKLVPAVTFKFKNVSDQTLGTLQANVLFRRAGEPEEWGSGFVRITGSDGLASGATSAPQTVKSQLGYTGSEPRQEMLANSQFVDARVELFAKYESTQWQLVGEYPIARRLIAP